MSTSNTPVINAANASVTDSGTHTDEHLVFTADASGSEITVEPNVTCYCRGTLIRTATGDTPIEDLRIGDCVLTASGEARPIRWLGSRGLDCTRHPNPALVWPIRIQAGAFAKDLPARDLWVSPFHSILVEGVLIHAQTLVNDATILQVPREQIEYWHLELDSHDILLAEGLPGESCLDVGNRSAFINGGAFVEAYPDFKPKHWTETCVPLVKDGPAVQSAKAALLARAEALGYVMTEDPDVHVMADGKRIEPVRLGETRLTFMLPAAGSTIELRCRSFIPAHLDPVTDDQRSLGICVGRLQFDGAEIALHNDEAFAVGWHGIEGNPEGHSWRWSCDRTPLPAGTRLVVIDIAGPSHYWAKSTSTVVALFG
jgi:Hint domain